MGLSTYISCSSFLMSDSTSIILYLSCVLRSSKAIEFIDGHCCFTYHEFAIRKLFHEFPGFGRVQGATFPGASAAMGELPVVD